MLELLVHHYLPRHVHPDAALLRLCATLTCCRSRTRPPRSNRDPRPNAGRTSKRRFAAGSRCWSASAGPGMVGGSGSRARIVGFAEADGWAKLLLQIVTYFMVAPLADARLPHHVPRVRQPRQPPPRQGQLPSLLGTHRAAVPASANAASRPRSGSSPPRSVPSALSSSPSSPTFGTAHRAVHRHLLRHAASSSSCCTSSSTKRSACTTRTAPRRPEGADAGAAAAIAVAVRALFRLAC